jgi:hypothetical protein
MQLTSTQYNTLERAIIDRRRIAVFRRGSEHVVLPERLMTRAGRETLETIQPSTGEQMTIYLDEIDDIEFIGG